MLSASEKIR